MVATPFKLPGYFSAFVMISSFGACALPHTPTKSVPVSTTLATLANQLTQQPPSQVTLLGEQHDVPEHQQMHHSAVLALSSSHQLAALVVEMAEQGRTTQLLHPLADEAGVQAALQWDTAAWPWAAYGPAVMAAVRAGVPVLGGNLPRALWRDTMQDINLDAKLPELALRAQHEAIRVGHCDLLPESQIAPMTRIQIARDRAMAATIKNASHPGKTVLLLAGHGHVNRTLGVPQHLPPGFTSQAIVLQATNVSGEAPSRSQFDAVWILGTAPLTDYCAAFNASRPQP